jgi:hypothetical protein
MDKSLLVSYGKYLLIFILATGIPVYIFIKARLLKEVCALFSIIISIALINLNFHFMSGSRSFPPPLSEFHEILWILPPIIVYVSCSYIHKRSIK